MQQQIIESMQAAGIVVDSLILDGEIHRLPVSNNGHKKNAWYVSVGRLMVWGRWDTGEKHKILPDKSTITSEDIEHIRQINQRIQEEKKIKQAEAANEAEKLITGGRRSVSFPYLKAKKIAPHISVVNGDMLCVPMFKSGQLVNVQRIYKDGTKRFLPGGEVIGAAAAITGRTETICICEGFATGASIFEATGNQVIIAFSASNMVPVARAVRAKYITSKIVVCADNDQPNKQYPDFGGTGLHCGKQAAAACGGSMRYPDQPGTDFNDLEHAAICAVINRTDGVCTASDLDDMGVFDLTLEIPDNILSVSGLISDGLESCANDSEIPNIVQYSFPVVISMIARAIAGKIRIGKIWPCIYNLKIGGTSTGKTDVDLAMRRNIIQHPAFQGFYGPTDFSSGPGLLRALSEPGCAKTIVNLDEITYLFRRMDKPDPVSAGKNQAILELYTKAGDEVKKPYGDKNKSITITEPCVIIIGNATPIIFDDFRLEDLQSGMMQRFDFWVYDGKIPYRKPYTGGVNQVMERFISGLQRIYTTPLIQSRGPHDMRGYISTAIDIGYTRQCADMINDYSRTIIDDSNAIDDPESGGQGINSRRYDLALKYALIHIASTRPVGKLMDPMGIENMQWGIDLAALVCGWKTKKLIGKVTSGQFHCDCEIFKSGIAACMKLEEKPTGKRIAHKKRRIKQLKPNEINDMIRALTARKEIIVDNSGPSTCYWLAKRQD